MGKEQKTAVIIGAGPAGLTAAWYLLEKTDIKPIVLEESGFVGGISRTEVHNGNRIDLGGHRFFSKNDEVMRLWQKLMALQSQPSKDDKILNRAVPLAADGKNPDTEDAVLLNRTRVSRILYLRKFFDYPISIKPATFLNMGLIRTTKAGFGYIYSAVFKRKELSLEDFFINRFGKPLYSMFFEDYTEKLWGVHPRNITADWGAQRVKGLSLFKVVLQALLKPLRRGRNKNVETSLIESFLYPKLGAGQMWEVMAEQVKSKGAEIIFNTKISNIKVKDDIITAVVDEKGREYKADYFLSSMPVKDLIVGMDNVPAEVQAIAADLPYRDFMTVALLVPKLKLKNTTKIKTVANIVPDCWIYVQEPDVKLGRLQIFNNWSPYMVKDWQNTVWIGLEYFCDEGDEYWNMSDEQFIDFAKNEVDKIGVLDKKSVLDAVRVRVKKAYPAYFGSYAGFDKVQGFLNSINNLYPIGRNGQHRYNNMDHSMLTALAAVECLAGKADKASLWTVNSEKEYHESKN